MPPPHGTARGASVGGPMAAPVSGAPDLVAVLNWRQVGHRSALTQWPTAGWPTTPAMTLGRGGPPAVCPCAQ